jgi:uncharacterized protein with ParB-like and HNH nuclease domain
MDEPKSLDSLFKEKIFRIPDYQRGYAWQHEQLKDFWEDLINLSSDRSHYTGVLTLKLIPAADISESSKEYWLVDDHSYQVLQIVDGQQRLTTFIIFLQAFADFVKTLPENLGKEDKEIFITENLDLQAVQRRFLFETKPNGDRFRTYKFGYESDNPSYDYMRHRIFGEAGGGFVKETFYTLNLCNAKTYFTEQVRQLHRQAGMKGLQDIYKKLTKKFLFNEYIIKDEFDVFVAFETMNNRGKKLSDLELLKNRLIYLTTLYSDHELDKASRKNLRDVINDAWREVYHQLGRNKTRPLNDDDFLRAHWTMYFKYSRKTGQDYIRFLLDEQFTPKKVHKKNESEVKLERPQEVRDVWEVEDVEDGVTDAVAIIKAELRPTEIRDYVQSLRDSSIHWFNSWYPELADGMSPSERQSIDRLNRLGMGYFRPLVMAILKNETNESERISIFTQIEKFTFVVFRLTSTMANSGSSEFYNFARSLDRNQTTLAAISSALEVRKSFTFNEDGTFRSGDFYNILYKKFKSGTGYYGWSGLRYFLYEFELGLLTRAVQKKVDWNDLLKSERDKISIEHIYPQTETPDWIQAFPGLDVDERRLHSSTLGNLLLLSMSINASLQNDNFADKKQVKLNDAREKIRHGYADGSHSEIEVAQLDSWGPTEIKERGLKLLTFMEQRWGFKFKSDDEKEQLLFLNLKKDVQ